jgi:hypothetical protein
MRRSLEIALVATLLAAFAAAAALQITATSPTYDEPVHLAAGYTTLKWRDYRLNAEHPPLLKKLAALPLLFQAVTAEQNDDWRAALADPGAEWTYAHSLFFGLRPEALERLGRRNLLEVRGTDPVTRSDYFNDVDRIFTAARSVVVLFGLALAFLVYLWTRELFGPVAALLSLALFCFEPNLIAHSSVVTTDVPLAACMFASVFFFWRTARTPTRASDIAFVIATAAAFIVKFTSFVLIPTLLILLLAKFSRRLLALLAIAGAITWLTIWSAYGWRFSAAADPVAAAMDEQAVAGRRPLPGLPDRPPGRFPLDYALRRYAADAQFYGDRQRPPSEEEATTAFRYASIRGAGSVLQSLARRRLLPEAYIYGVAFARERSVFRPSYLRGSYSNAGFGSYFFWTILLKTPIVTLLSIGAGIAILLRKRGARWFLIAPVIVYLLVAVQANLNIGHRHLLPILPFLLVAAGVLATKMKGVAVAAIAAVAALTGAVVLSPAGVTSVVRDRIAYINELGGGPLSGYRSLVDSNFDWGQGLPRLRRWLDENGVDGPINLSYFGTADPKYYGIRHRNVFYGYEYEPDDNFEVVPGPLAISATHLIGSQYDAAGREELRRFRQGWGSEPAGRAGSSILVFNRPKTAE